MEGYTSWFNEEPAAKPIRATTGDAIMLFVQGKAMFYGAEIADSMQLDPRTVTKWLKRLVAEKRIERVNMKVPPTPAQVERIQELRNAGMRTNNLKNAKWYVALKEEDHEGN